MRKVIIILPIIFLFTLLASCAAPAPTPPTASELLDLGERYLLDLDYEQAVAQFLAVIEIEPMNARAYIGAAEAYIALGRTDDAVAVLERGLDATDDVAIAEMLARLHGVTEPISTENVTLTQSIDLDMELTHEQLDYLEPIETAILSMDFEAAYGIATSTTFRLMFAEISNGRNVSYKSDGMGLWRLRYTNMENSPERYYGEEDSTCSIGVYLHDGQIYWFDSFVIDGKYGSNFRIYNNERETIRLTIFDSQNVSHHNGELDI